MKKMMNLLAVVSLCVSALVGCGGTAEQQPDEAVASAEQSLRACLDDGSQSGGVCPSGYSCVNGTCRVECSEDFTCGSGQKCCQGYMYSDGSIMTPYCTSTSSTCYQPW